MPQPKSSDDARLSQLRELLGQAVVIPTERLQAVLDDARRRGHIDTKGVEEIVQGVLKQSEDARTRLETLLGRVAEATGLRRAPTSGRGKKDGTQPTQTERTKERAKASTPAARTKAAASGSKGAPAAAKKDTASKGGASTTARGFPIKGYDDLKAAEITAKLDGLTAAQLKKVRKHESDGKSRKGILSAIDRKLK